MAKAAKHSGRLSPGGWVRVLGTLLALGLVVFLISEQGWGEISDAVSRIEPWRFAVAILLTLVSRCGCGASLAYFIALGWHPSYLDAKLADYFCGLVRQ